MKKIFTVMAFLVFSFALIVSGQTAITPPDMTVCDSITCETLQDSVCSPAGFKITLTNYDPASTSNSGTATYTYEICADTINCPPEYPFHELSHFDVTFPALGGIGSCLGSETQVNGECTAVDNTPLNGHTASVGSWGRGDASCFGSGPGSQAFVAKCDETNLKMGDCLVMTVSIAGENTGLGLGAAVLVDKEATECTASCVAGPSCTDCYVPPDGGSECLTRTIGFWGTHPHIATLYDPVTVCGIVVDGQDAGTCSTSEALCTSAGDRRSNPTYLSLVAQLTAAKLNLNATIALSSGGTCASWLYGGKTIQEWIAYCEANFCSASKKAISVSGCIAALTGFNESQDTGFDVTPPPFDQPGPADPSECQLARGNGKYIGGFPGCGQ